MATHALVICEHCGFSTDQDEQDGQSGGQHLLNQLMPLYEAWHRKVDTPNSPPLPTQSCPTL